MTLQLAYYADDFTGSTDALEFLTRAGARAALFIEPPTEDQLKRYGHLDAIGVAGLTRSMKADRIQKTLQRDFARLRMLNPRHVHYKVCSTFDSSPEIGSIGRAIEVGSSVFDSEFVPLLVAAPALGRYCAFGNLFARMGIGSQGEIFRLDRHPSMRTHPVTPATESDLRIHLGAQTSKRIGLFDVLALASEAEVLHRHLRAMRVAGDEIILFDAVYPEHLDAIGRLLEHSVSADKPLFSVGSSGVEMALGKAWAAADRFAPRESFPSVGEASPLLVVSGSCSVVSAGQIEWARSHGFADVTVHSSLLVKDGTCRTEEDRAVGEVTRLLRSGQSVVLHTAVGPNDPRILAARTLLQGRDSGALLGGVLGSIARQCIQSVGPLRLVLAGGDSSSYAARALGIESVEMIAPLAPGAPLCRARAPGSPADGIEINFKGGQVGAEDYYGYVARGGIH